MLKKPVRYGTVALFSTVPLFIGMATAWADGSITLDFVRHAQAENNVPGLLDTKPPGEPLTDLGQTQAQILAGQLATKTSKASTPHNSPRIIRPQRHWPGIWDCRCRHCPGSTTFPPASSTA